MEHQQHHSASSTAFTAPGWPSVLPQGAISREIVFSVRSFDYLKQFQRRYEAQRGVRLSNGQAVAEIMEEHRELNRSIKGEQGYEQSRSTPSR